MKIGQRDIGMTQPPFVIAEISGNHGGSFTKARQLIGAAKRAGADAVKTQAYEPDTITLDIKKPDFIVQDGLWKGRTLYELYSKAHTPFKWHPELYKVAHDIGMTIFSSVFDYSSIDLMEQLACPAYKIASFEIIDIPLIERAAQTRKPIIVSTGMASVFEIQDANQAVGENPGAFLHCTSEYPADTSRAGLIEMLDLRAMLPNRNIGISDHTVGPIVPIAATAMGACIIEKHLRLNGDRTSEDADFSLDERQFTDMVGHVRQTWEAVQSPEAKVNASRQLRRSLYAVEDIQEGESFSATNVRSIRPGYGLPPKKLPGLIGKRARHLYRKGDRIT